MLRDQSILTSAPDFSAIEQERWGKSFGITIGQPSDAQKEKFASHTKMK